MPVVLEEQGKGLWGVSDERRRKVMGGQILQTEVGSLDFILRVMGSYGRFLSRGKGEIGFTFSWVIKDVGKVKSECIAQLLGVK